MQSRVVETSCKVSPFPFGPLGLPSNPLSQAQVPSALGREVRLLSTPHGSGQARSVACTDLLFLQAAE